MNPHIVHRHNHAVVVLDGDVDKASCRALLDAIGTAVDYYGYRLVEIQIDSPGGNGRPLKHLLDRLDLYRVQGVRFRTSAISIASSAGAVLVALGDERVAAPGSRLLFHGSWLYRRGQLTARDCAGLHARLSRSDDKLLYRLVDRAFAGPVTAPVHGAQTSDRKVLEQLCADAELDPKATDPDRVQTLAATLGQTVDEAIKGDDRETISKLYRRLIQFDRPISGSLAKTLHLVDLVIDSDAGSTVGIENPGFVLPDGIPFASPTGGLAPETLLRHVLVLGDDAGAATDLCLAPLAIALAAAPARQVGPVLVLNPDPELTGVLEAVSQGRLQRLNLDRIVIDLMGRDRSLVPLLKSGHWMSAATSILKRTLDLVPGSPARCLLDVSGRVFDPVLREGTHLALSVIGFVLMLTSTSRCPEDWAESRDSGFVADLRLRARGVEGEPGPNVFGLAAWLLGMVPGLLPARVAKEAIDAFGDGGPEERDVHRGLDVGGEALSHPSGHARDVLSIAQAIVAPFAGPAARTSLYVGCESGFDPTKALDVAALVSGSPDRRFLLLVPQADGSDTLVATAVKQLFLEALLGVAARAGSLQPPLSGYIARDFERYVTAVDSVFLDCARNGGGFAVLTSKSVSAIEHALRDVPGGDATFGALWSAVGTKLFLRSTDPRTAEVAGKLAPRLPGLSAVLDVRPLSGLGLDDTYLSSVDGRFERRRLASWSAAVLDDDVFGEQT